MKWNFNFALKVEVAEVETMQDQAVLEALVSFYEM
jgi:hypothetical protein